MTDVIPIDNIAIAIPWDAFPCSNCRYINVEEVSVLGGRNINEPTNSRIEIQKLVSTPTQYQVAVMAK